MHMMEIEVSKNGENLISPDSLDKEVLFCIFCPAKKPQSKLMRSSIRKQETNKPLG